jgi:hypothetical protein
MKTAVFWVVAPCRLVKFTDVSEVPATSIISAMKMEATGTSETSVNSYKVDDATTRNTAIFGLQINKSSREVHLIITVTVLSSSFEVCCQSLRV